MMMLIHVCITLTLSGKIGAYKEIEMPYILFIIVLRMDAVSNY